MLLSRMIMQIGLGEAEPGGDGHMTVVFDGKAMAVSEIARVAGLGKKLGPYQMKPG